MDRRLAELLSAGQSTEAYELLASVHPQLLKGEGVGALRVRDLLAQLIERKMVEPANTVLSCLEVLDARRVTATLLHALLHLNAQARMPERSAALLAQLKNKRSFLTVIDFGAVIEAFAPVMEFAIILKLFKDAQAWKLQSTGGIGALANATGTRVTGTRTGTKAAGTVTGTQGKNSMALMHAKGRLAAQATFSWRQLLIVFVSALLLRKPSVAKSVRSYLLQTTGSSETGTVTGSSGKSVKSDGKSVRSDGKDISNRNDGSGLTTKTLALLERICKLGSEDPRVLACVRELFQSEQSDPATIGDFIVQLESKYFSGALVQHPKDKQQQRKQVSVELRVKNFIQQHKWQELSQFVHQLVLEKKDSTTSIETLIIPAVHACITADAISSASTMLLDLIVHTGHTLSTFTLTMQLCIAKKDWNGVLACFSQATSLDMVDPSFYSAILKALNELKEYVTARELFEATDERIQNDESVVREMVQVYTQLREYGIASALLEHLIHMKSSAPELQSSIDFYINELVDNSCWEEVDDWFVKMQQLQVIPSKYSNQNILRAYVKQQQYDTAKQFFEQLSQPSVYSYLTMLNAHIHEKQYHLALTLLETMLERKVSIPSRRLANLFALEFAILRSDNDDKHNLLLRFKQFIDNNQRVMVQGLLANRSALPVTDTSNATVTKQ